MIEFESVVYPVDDRSVESVRILFSLSLFRSRVCFYEALLEGWVLAIDLFACSLRAIKGDNDVFLSWSCQCDSGRNILCVSVLSDSSTATGFRPSVLYESELHGAI